MRSPGTEGEQRRNQQHQGADYGREETRAYRRVATGARNPLSLNDDEKPGAAEGNGHGEVG
jgi:hypothetical protein